jgi:hypothetical protein
MFGQLMSGFSRMEKRYFSRIESLRDREISTIGLFYQEIGSMNDPRVLADHVQEMNHSG